MPGYVSYAELKSFGIPFAKHVLIQMFECAGGFPKPVDRWRLAWRRADIEHWLAERERDRQAPLYRDGMIRYYKESIY
jgi:hypothetical protein